jgi:prepilin-type processing-associated H-X9-DG protein
MTPHFEPPLKSLTNVKSPGSKIFMTEFLDNLIGDHFHPASWDAYLSFPENEIAMRRHSSQANYWFVDGHVEKMIFSQTWNINQTVNMYDPYRQ